MCFQLTSLSKSFAAHITDMIPYACMDQLVVLNYQPGKKFYCKHHTHGFFGLHGSTRVVSKYKPE
jgi:hypothetical protein